MQILLDQWLANNLALEVYWFPQLPIHAVGIWKSLDGSRYGCIMTGNKAVSQMETLTKTPLLFILSCIEFSWTKEAAVNCSSSTASLLQKPLIETESDEIVWQWKSLMWKALLVVTVKLSWLDKRNVFCSYRLHFVLCQMLPSCYPQLSTETGTLSVT